MKPTDKKKRMQRNFNLVILLFILLFSVALLDKFMALQKQDKNLSIQNDYPSSDVQKYTPILNNELKLLQLENYTEVLAAIMEQESKGKGGDPMQSSESAGLAPNTIDDPQQSIKQGVKHFQRTLTYGNQKRVDFPTIIQAYNMGMGYIDYVAENGGNHSEEIAKKFSFIQVQKNPEIYDCGGDQNNFRYPYCYGDFTYSTKVTKNIETLTASNL